MSDYRAGRRDVLTYKPYGTSGAGEEYARGWTEGLIERLMRELDRQGKGAA